MTKKSPVQVAADAMGHSQNRKALKAISALEAEGMLAKPNPLPGSLTTVRLTSELMATLLQGHVGELDKETSAAIMLAWAKAAAALDIFARINMTKDQRGDVEKHKLAIMQRMASQYAGAGLL